MAWARNGTPHTLSSTADELQISDLGSKKFNQILTHVFNSGGSSTKKKMNLNNDGIAGTTYALRRSANGAADGTLLSTGYYDIWHNQTDDWFTVVYIFADSTEEKLLIFFTCSNGGAGAANDPNRRESVGKDSVADALTQIDIDNDSTGDFDSGSNLTAIGTD